MMPAAGRIAFLKDGSCFTLVCWFVRSCIPALVGWLIGLWDRWFVGPLVGIGGGGAQGRDDTGRRHDRLPEARFMFTLFVVRSIIIDTRT